MAAQREVMRTVLIRWGVRLVVLLFLVVVGAFLGPVWTGWVGFGPEGEARWAAACLVLILLTPLLQFLLYGWHARRREVLDLFPFEAILLYYQTYFVTSKVPFVQQKRKEYLRAKEVWAAGPRKAEGQEGPSPMDAVQGETRKDFEDHFDQRYGRRHFIIPTGLLVLVAGTLAVLCARFLLAVPPGDASIEHDPANFTVILCLAGAYCYVLYDFVSRERSLDFSTTHVNWATFRLLFSAPLAYAIPSLWHEARLAVAFLLGTFPTGFLMVVLRRRGGQLVGATEAPEDQTSKLEGLPSVDTATADRFREEGITTIAQLASADPVTLTIRTGFPLRFILDCVSEALAWYYLQAEGMRLARTHSIMGALEIYGLVEELDYDATGADPNDLDVKRYLADQQLARAVVKAVGEKLTGGPDILERNLRCVWDDSRVEFLARLMDAISPPPAEPAACHGGAAVARRAAAALGVVPAAPAPVSTPAN